METDTTQQQVEIDSGRQEKAREYARLRRQLSFINMGIAVIGIIFIFWSELYIGLRDWLQPLSWQPVAGWYPLQVAAYFLILMLGYQIITSPLVYYGGFTLPHRYELSTMTLRSWLADFLKGLVLGLILETIVVELIYLLLATQPQTWWLEVALILLFFTVVMANLAPILILPLFYKFTPLPEGELTQRLLALANRAHTRVRGVFTMHMSSKTTAANAALMGLGNTLHWTVDVQHYYLSLTDVATIPFVLVLTGLFGLIVMPIGNGLSRAIEYQADEYALQTTKMVGVFKSAMTRLANQNLADVEPSPLVEILFHDHPSIGKRLKHADAFAERYALNASLSAESLAPTSSIEPLGMPSSGSSRPDSAH